MNVLVFEDSQVELLYPVTTSRPAFAVNIGTYRLFDFLTRWDSELTPFVRPHLRELVALDFPQVKSALGRHDWTLVVNARLVPSIQNFNHLQKFITDNELHAETVNSHR